MERVCSLLHALLLAQLASLSVAAASLTSSFIANIGYDVPLAQALVGYTTVALLYGSLFLYRRKGLMVPFYWYALIAFADVQGNYLVVKAYQYTSITDVSLLNCCNIIWSVALTRLLLKTKYSKWQFLGAAVCLGGLSLLLLSESQASEGGGKNPVLGDALVIVGTLFYTLSAVGQEYFVKKKDLLEILAMISTSGVIISTCETALIEGREIQLLKLSPKVVFIFIAFGLAMALFYTLIPFILKLKGVAFFNLSLLTTNMWAVFIRIFFYHQQVGWQYFLAFGIVLLGLIIYSMTSEAASSASSPTAGEGQNGNYRPLGLEVEEEANIHGRL